MFHAPIVRPLALVLAAGALISAAPHAHANIRPRTARVKPTSTHNFTSWMFETDNNRATVIPPTGWTARQQGNSRSWHITANAGNAGVPPGGTFTVNVSNQGGVGDSIRFVGGDYVANGKTVWLQQCGDPVASKVVAGGETGATFLGYSVPAGQFGYFYEQWAPMTATGQINQTRIHVGADAQAHNFQVLPNSFPIVAPGARGLSDIPISPLTPADDSAFAMQDGMNESDALGIPGMPTGWGFDPLTGVATMDFSGGSSFAPGGGGLAAGMTSCLVAFTSPFEPTTSHDNVEYVYDSFGCPESPVYNGTLVPFTAVPAPGAAGLVLGGLILVAPRRRR